MPRMVTESSLLSVTRRFKSRPSNTGSIWGDVSRLVFRNVISRLDKEGKRTDSLKEANKSGQRGVTPFGPTIHVNFSTRGKTNPDSPQNLRSCTLSSPGPPNSRLFSFWRRQNLFWGKGGGVCSNFGITKTFKVSSVSRASSARSFGYSAKQTFTP
uniref:Uncharacterized protein n=1 Tax=Chromera velia CCMP2878 TaxID=1169474 RepID=A0A0G4GNS4_9ALVE|eukprot:Cvel_22699.t1-p1 / transcript=Cvel_22699.t1 / gene=Cvel_22699 / organism=Chromera_velia_CCMP2878 / gene_product=hypothetical protein / transcript_product=hypothetical protein / location=Cvel_scaffold2261:5575-6039(-) / protein_length=155 / sequence_SO=supercontig / SO=protein_coding / is_pseudo=false